MKKRLFYALLVTMFTACTLPEGFKDVTNNNGVEQPSRPDYIYIDFEEETRVELNDDKKTIWSEGDQVVRFGTDILDVWKYTGLTGEDTDRFDFVKDMEILDEFDYKDKYYVFYSYDSFLEVMYTPDGAEVLHQIEPMQNYVPNTYDPKSNIMVAESTNREMFSLDNLMGYLHIPMVGDKTVSKITVTGNNNEILNGQRWVVMSDPDTTSWDENTSKTTTLNCDSGVKLTQKATDFYITLVPTEFSKGLAVEILFDDKTSKLVSIEEKMTIKRNRICHIEQIDTAEPEPEPEPEPDFAQTIAIKHKGDMVAFPILDSAYVILWGDENSNVVEYYSDFIGSYVYDDGLSSHTITIHSDSAKSFEINSCSGITEIDFSQF